MAEATALVILGTRLGDGVNCLKQRGQVMKAMSPVMGDAMGEG